MYVKYACVERFDIESFNRSSNWISNSEKSNKLNDQILGKKEVQIY